MVQFNIIRTKRKTLFINDECYGTYYCTNKLTISKCNCFHENKSFPNKCIIKTNSLDDIVKLNDYLNCDLNKYMYLYWKSSTISISDIPSSIIYIQYNGNTNIIWMLPSELIHLIFGGNFNHPVDNLPSTLKILHLGSVFNHPVDNLPVGLEHIIFGDSFNHSVDSLPETLIYIQLPKFYTKDILNLPKSVQQIKLNREYKKTNYVESMKLLENKISWFW